MGKVFAVRSFQERTRIDEASDDGRGLDAWIWRDGRYEYRTTSLEEAIRVALRSCHAVRQEYADHTVEQLLELQRSFSAELERHTFRLMRQPWVERILAVQEELEARLESCPDGVELESYCPSFGWDFRGGPWRVILAKYAYTKKELAATGNNPNDILFIKRLKLVA